jgi:hypothetical protein
VCKIEGSRGWVESFITRQNGELTEKKSSPQEEPRLQVPQVFLEETIRTMHETLQGCPLDLVFNLDEVGMSGWEDRKPRKVVIRITVGAHNIHYRISRNLKHISIVTCISAGGAWLAPYVVTSQDSAALHRALEKIGMQIGRDLILRQPSKLNINVDLFENYIRTVFRPHVGGEDAVLLMDNCSPHLTPTVIGLLSEARVKIVTFAPHTTHIFQVLDLALFGVLKRHGQYQLPFDNDAGTGHFIKKVDHDFRSTMTDANIWGAFRGIGLSYGLVYGVHRVSFNEITLRESNGFRELWDVDFPLGNLSSRRRNARSDWINKPE